MGPDMSTVHCSLCSNKYKHNETSLTSNLIKHMKSVHREEFHAAKVKESRDTVIKEIASTEDSNTEYEEIKQNVVEEDEANEDKSVKTFNPTLVLERNPKSLCWNFFFFKGTKEDGAVRSRVYCNICNMSLLYSGSTTALTSHVRKKHQNELKKAGIREIDRLAKELQSSPVTEDNECEESKGHPVWMFMENIGGGQARCQMCGRIVFFNKNMGNLRGHILKGHSETQQALILRKAIQGRITSKKEKNSGQLKFFLKI